MSRMLLDKRRLGRDPDARQRKREKIILRRKQQVGVLLALVSLLDLQRWHVSSKEERLGPQRLM